MGYVRLVITRNEYDAFTTTIVKMKPNIERTFSTLQHTSSLFGSYLPWNPYQIQVSYSVLKLSTRYQWSRRPYQGRVSVESFQTYAFPVLLYLQDRVSGPCQAYSERAAFSGQRCKARAKRSTPSSSSSFCRIYLGIAPSQSRNSCRTIYHGIRMRPRRSRTLKQQRTLHRVYSVRSALLFTIRSVIRRLLWM